MTTTLANLFKRSLTLFTIIIMTMGATTGCKSSETDASATIFEIPSAYAEQPVVTQKQQQVAQSQDDKPQPEIFAQKSSEAQNQNDKHDQKNEKSCVNIHTADAKTLETLPGIGPALAGRIIEYRQKRSFKKIKHLRRVKGIGPKKFKKLKALICVS